MHFRLVMLPVILLFWASCTEEPEEKVRIPESIVAGQTSGNGIVYTNPQPDDSFYFAGLASQEVFYDLNRDGNDDLVFSMTDYPDSVSGYYSASLRPVYPNQIVRTPQLDYYLRPLNAGDTIGRNSYWHEGSAFMFYEGWDPGHHWSTGQWDTIRHAFAGVKLITGADTSYCWISLFHSKEPPHALVIRDYAYTIRYTEP